MLIWIAPLLVFGIVVFVHELGHFLAAKAVGVYAPRFSIGFGPALWRMRRGETEYVIAALPLGGYVRMASREDAEATALLEGGAEASVHAEHPVRDADSEAMVPFGPRPVPPDRWFESKPLWARLLIMLAGVGMNALLALVVSIGLAAHYGRTVIATRVVGLVRAVPGAPQLSGLYPGDTIHRVDRTSVRNWNDVVRAITEGDGPVVLLTTNRGTLTISVADSRNRNALVESINPYYPPVIERVLEGKAAARAGFLAADSIITVDGRRTQSWYDVVSQVKSAPGRALLVEVGRGGGTTQLHVVPDSAGPRGGPVQGLIGVTPSIPTAHERVSASEAVVEGWHLTGFAATSVIKSVRGLVTRQNSMREVGGAIAIARQSVAAARDGIDQLLWLLSLISINLAIVNLLPVPILDGGQILFVVTEAVKGSPFSSRTRSVVMWSGLVVIVLLFVFTTLNDLRNWWRPSS